MGRVERVPRCVAHPDPQRDGTLPARHRHGRVRLDLHVSHRSRRAPDRDGARGPLVRESRRDAHLSRGPGREPAARHVLAWRELLRAIHLAGGDGELERGSSPRRAIRRDRQDPQRDDLLAIGADRRALRHHVDVQRGRDAQVERLLPVVGEADAGRDDHRHVRVAVLVGAGRSELVPRDGDPDRRPWLRVRDGDPAAVELQRRPGEAIPGSRGHDRDLRPPLAWREELGLEPACGDGSDALDLSDAAGEGRRLGRPLDDEERGPIRAEEEPPRLGPDHERRRSGARGRRAGANDRDDRGRHPGASAQLWPWPHRATSRRSRSPRPRAAPCTGPSAARCARSRLG